MLEQWKPISLSFPERLESATLRLPLLYVVGFAPRAAALSRVIQNELKPVPSKPSRYSDSYVPPRHFESNLLDFIELGRRHSFLPILVIPYGIPFDYQKVVFSVAQRYQIPLVNIHERFSHFRAEEISARPELEELLRPYRQWLGPDALASDPILLLTTDGSHPNPLGDRLIAEALLQAIEPHLKHFPPPASPRPVTLP
jgi:hypothetical protein